jgi:prephenate dehydrogenase
VKRRTVGIVGTGLIGGSIGMRARRDGALVVGYDAKPSALARAIEVGAIDLGATREELYARAGTVVIAAPPEAALAEIEQLKREPPVRATLIVDVASVKAAICDAGRELANFVATHPMAGSERSGVRAARADLFEGRTWAYVPSGHAPSDARARALIASLGAMPLAIEAHEHDRIVAFTSHLPQVVASHFATRAEALSSEALYPLCGVAARELLRLGDSDFALWREILRANAPAVETELRLLGTALVAAADNLAQGEVDRLAAVFSQARPRR